MGIFTWLKQLISKQYPVLKDSYLVLSGNKQLARLSAPVYDDMFWTSFLLTPSIQDASDLEKLYSDEFWWSADIRIIESDTGRTVMFTLAALVDDEENFLDYMPLKPERVRLKGPYPM
jgi:hypothetical protein